MIQRLNGRVASHSVYDLRAIGNSSFIETEGHSSKFIQILDESMCVVREDLTDWLQRYLFATHAPPIEPPLLLFRLGSGLWLSRLAYKLHLSVLQPSSNVKTTDSYEFLRGAVSSKKLKVVSRTSLPQFPPTLITCARIPLGPTDVSPFPLADSSPSGSPSGSSTHSSIAHSDDNGNCKPVASVRIADRWAARDNVSCFIQWCRELGIPQTVLFETTGLVHRTEEKNVLLTLMELARIASRYGLDDLPELVRMELEIDKLEAEHLRREQMHTKETAQDFGSSTSADVQKIIARDTGILTTGTFHMSASPVTKSISLDANLSNSSTSPTGDHCDMAGGPSDLKGTNSTQTYPADQAIDASASSVAVGAVDAGSEASWNTSSSRHSDEFVADQVEKKVAQCTCCNRLHMQYLSEGRYRFRNRIYYLRRFRNHVMVRVGGGWLTLDEFLIRYDPCRRGSASCSSLASSTINLASTANTDRPGAVSTNNGQTDETFSTSVNENNIRGSASSLQHVNQVHRLASLPSDFTPATGPIARPRLPLAHTAPTRSNMSLSYSELPGSPRRSQRPKSPGSASSVVVRRTSHSSEQLPGTARPRPPLNTTVKRGLKISQSTDNSTARRPALPTCLKPQGNVCGTAVQSTVSKGSSVPSKQRVPVTPKTTICRN